MAGLGSLVAPLVADVGTALTPSSLISQLAASGAATLIISGLQTSAGANAVDPLHLVFKPNTTTTTPTATVSAPVPTISAAAFATLPVATQNSLIAQGVHIS